uniref:Uncharacterized protein n=1 Tax=Anguilla anguilla TaxID=7936 RepID=A0A0E9WQN8_ANGAN
MLLAHKKNHSDTQTLTTAKGTRHQSALYSNYCNLSLVANYNGNIS